MILAGDIGATKVNLAYYEQQGDRLLAVLAESYPSRDFKSLEEVIGVMLRDHPSLITAAAFGIAGPIVNHRSKLTNLGWDVDGLSVASALGLSRVGLLNDLAATAYGTLRVELHDRVVLQSGQRQPGGAIAVIAAGTGLGEGGLVWDGKRYRALPSEGGHTDFGPRDDVEIALLQFLLKRHKRISYERIVAGPGFRNLYDFFRARSDSPEPEWLKAAMSSGDPSAVISRAGLERTDEVCVQALDRFVSLYGAETGNLALKVLSTGGVCVCGGIAPKIIDRIRNGAFMESFLNKGRYESLLRTMHVEVITNEKTALLGAAHFAVLMQEGSA
jgi:glucokinase